MQALMEFISTLLKLLNTLNKEYFNGIILIISSDSLQGDSFLRKS